MIGKDRIIQARQADLYAYLINRGEPLVQNGIRWRHKKHDSLIFTKNAFYWNSRQEHGNAIDFLMLFYNMDFRQAVEELTGYTDAKNQNNASVETAFTVPVTTKDMRRAIAYLIKSRGISPALVQELVAKKLIMQTSENNNILFPWYDGERLIGGETVGTLTDCRYKGIISGSQYGYGYCIKYGNQDKAFFFESAIDAISYIQILQSRNPDHAKNAVFISMAGLKTEVITETLKRRQGTLNKIYICVDNDSAGHEFYKALELKIGGFIRNSPQGDIKDWNEYLQTKRD